MSKSLRLSEKWYRRGLWLVAVLFAWFLIGLGAKIVMDLPSVENIPTVEDFIAPEDAQQAREAIEHADARARQAEAALQTASEAHQSAARDYQAAHASFTNWIATRQATQGPQHDREVTMRTAALDTLKQAEVRARQQQEARTVELRERRAEEARALEHMEALRETAHEHWQRARSRQDMRVFLYRLALTLPLLAVAAWLFVRHRRGQWWPFVWGFVFFALFTFFVELVPYFPDYGGYVRYVVGIVVTALAGRQAIIALHRYLERQKKAEALPAAQRQQHMALTYDAALARLDKGICPGCERPVDLKDGVTDFCPHCGIGLFTTCGGCQVRKSAFTRFCFRCGTAAPAPAPAGSADNPPF